MSSMLLWHGWGMQPQIWQPLTETLRAQHGVHAQAMPLPGYAGSAAPHPHRARNAVHAMLADVAAPVTLCGWSLGAMLAMQAACLQPDKVARLILIGASPSFVTRPGWEHGIAPAMLDGFAAALATRPAAVMRHFISLCHRGDAQAARIGGEMASLPCALPATDVLTAGLAMLGDMDLRQAISELTQPVLLLHGMHDALVPPQAAAWLRERLPQVRLDILPCAGHAPFLSDPHHCVAAIARFLHD